MSSKNVIKRVFGVSNLAICTQLVFSPYAMANKTADQKESAWKTAATAVQVAGEMAAQVAKGYAAQMSAPNPNAVAAQVDQLTKTMGVKPVQDQSQIPPFLRNCMVLEAKGTRPNMASQCSQMTMADYQSGYMEAFLNIAESNSQTYDNMLTASHERFTSHGAGCYESNLSNINSMLLAREEELNKLKNFYKEKINAFKEANEQNLEQIKAKQALLTGKPASYNRNVKFDELFADKNNVCASYVDKSEFRSNGKKGLIGIEEMLSKKSSKISGKENIFTPAEMLGSKANDINKEIDKIAKNLAGRIKAQDSLEVKLEDITFNSKFIKRNNPALKDIVTTYTAQIEEKRENLDKKYSIKQIQSDKKIQQIISGIQRNSVNPEARLEEYERTSKNACLTELVKSNFGSTEGFTKRLEDRNVSKRANAESENSLANEIVSILDEDDLTIDEKLKRIQGEEKSGLNQNYKITTGRATTIGGEKVSASSRLNPSMIIKKFVTNCNDKFDKVRNSDGFTKKDIVEKVKAYNASVSNLRSEAQSGLQQRIVNRLKNCESDTSTGVSANSCTDALNIQSPNFCVRTAQKCASNMNACQDKAKQVMDKIKKEQEIVAESYALNMKELKDTLKAELKNVNVFMEGQARSLDTQFELGGVFNVPGFNFDTLSKDKNRYLKGAGFDESLQLEDPEKYLAMAHAQVDKMLKKAQEQRVKYLGAKPSIDSNGTKVFPGELGQVAEKYKKNYSKEKAYWDGQVKACIGMVKGMEKAVADHNEKEKKRIADSNQQIAETCANVQAFNHDPESMCGEAGDLAQSVLEISNLAGGSAAGRNPASSSAYKTLKSYDSKCNAKVESGGEIDEDAPQLIKGDSKNVTTKEFCADEKAMALWKVSPAKKCKEFSEITKPYKNGACDDAKFDKLAKAKNLKLCQKVVTEGDSQYYDYKLKKECDDAQDEVAVKLSAIQEYDKYTNVLVGKIKTEFSCYPRANPPKQLKEKEEALAKIVASYNRHLKIKSLRTGQKINVAICGATGNGEITGKSLMQTGSEVANLIGRSLAQDNQ